MYVLDVGQGDSILIKTADNKYILVDGGPDDSVLGQLQGIIPYWHRQIDLVILTHPDQDHVGGLPAVLNYFEVKHVIYNNIDQNNYAYTNLKNIIKDKDIHRIIINSEIDLKVGCCTYLDTMWPFEDTNLEPTATATLCTCSPFVWP